MTRTACRKLNNHSAGIHPGFFCFRRHMLKIQIESNLIRYLLRNAYFLNGTAYAGKSTMVRLLAEKYNGICCSENYHLIFREATNPEHQPCTGYFQTMSGWQEFVSRSPEEYAAWIEGSVREAAEMEILHLVQLSQEGRRIFVDTNISVEILKEIAPWNHVAIMLSPHSMSVERFFDRSDPEKQFILQQLQAHPDPEWAIANYRACLEKINSREVYDAFAGSGFFTHVRTEKSTIEGTLSILARHFGLEP